MDRGDRKDLLGRFWRELHATRTGMLGLVDENEAHSQPMTAHFEGEQGPLWFFARRDALLTQELEGENRAVFHYVAGGHDLYACVHGRLARDDRRDIIERFWSEDVARWYPQGQSDPNLALLRFDTERAQIWDPNASLDASEFRFAGHGEPQDVRTTVEMPNSPQ